MSSDDAAQDATTEGLAQLIDIAHDEDERRKTADSKLSSIQNALGFIVTLAGGTIAIAFLQAPSYDVWHILVLLLLAIAVFFLIRASLKIFEANDPKPYQARVAGGVRKMLNASATKIDLQNDAINDFVANITQNIERTNERLGLYREAVHNVRLGVVAAGIVPALVFLSYVGHALQTAWPLVASGGLGSPASLTTAIRAAALQSNATLSVLSFILPLGGIALSCWSFSFAEAGATPDQFPGVNTYWDANEQVAMGQRFRARLSARAAFICGALLLAAAVPMGVASGHVSDPLNLSAAAGYLIILAAILYGLNEARRIWLTRRADAFRIYYDAEMERMYHEKPVRHLFFKLNRMPIWSLLDRRWFIKQRNPPIEDVVRIAQKTFGETR